MAKQLDCVVDGCEASITEETVAEILEVAEGHAAEEHPDLELDEETVQTLKDNIEEV
jgi:predicted small metal-binding protein